jgi:GNAT superfamily N-acetyltransferase
MSGDMEIRAVGSDEIGACFALSSLVGWNQNEADWRWMLKAGQVYGIDADGRLIATALTLPYGGRFAWISMVLVDPAFRGRGLATRLMQRAVADLEAQGLVPLLDATPAGREVYRRIGFRDTWTMRRWRVPCGTATGTARPLEDRDWPTLAKLDRAAFGADRGALLSHLAGRLPAAARVSEGGFCLGRDGRTADQIGPVVAADEAAAIDLIGAALAALPPGRAAYIDLLDRCGMVAGWLERLGGAVERPYTRMVYGRDQGFDDPGLLVAAAGPELG